MNFKALLLTIPLAASASAAGPPTFASVTHAPLYTFFGDSLNDYFGHSVSGAGDVNGDGFADMIVGAMWDDNNGLDSGSARVLSGIDGSTLHTFYGDAAGDEFGWAVSGAGDVNGDGFADMIVGARSDDNNGMQSGSARVFSGIDGAALYTFNGDSINNYFGTSVSGAGDVDGDGFDDMIVGAHFAPHNGANVGIARVLSGGTGATLYTFNGDSRSDWFGISVSGAGDVNGDGFADMIVGAQFDDNRGDDSGSARVLSGIDGSTLYAFYGDASGDHFGGAVSSAGDVNNDGFADLIVGAEGVDRNGSVSGSARVLSGIDGSTLHTFYGDAAGDQFGVSVSGAGDVDGDGFADLIVGAFLADFDRRQTGIARLLSGATGAVMYTFAGDGNFDDFGVSVSGAGDINGDGYADFIVGAQNGGLNRTGFVRAFVSQVRVPEPSAFLLASLLAAGIVCRRIR